MQFQCLPVERGHCWSGEAALLVHILCLWAKSDAHQAQFAPTSLVSRLEEPGNTCTQLMESSKRAEGTCQDRGWSCFLLFCKDSEGGQDISQALLHPFLPEVHLSTSGAAEPPLSCSPPIHTALGCITRGCQRPDLPGCFPQAVGITAVTHCTDFRAGWVLARCRQFSVSGL